MNVYKHLGVLFTDNMNSGLTHDFFSPILDSFKKTVEKKGYSLSFINADKTSPDSITYLEQMQNYRMDGALILNLNTIDDEVQQLFDSEYPIVTIDYKTPGAVSISSDNCNGISDMVSYVYEMGHRRIAYLIGDQDSHVSNIRLESFKDACATLGMVQIPEYFRECKYRDMRAAGRITEELLALSNPPTCIFYPDDYAAVGGINIIRGRGLEVPKDISYCGFDGVNLVGYFEPSITTVRQDVKTIGRVAGENLMHMVENGLNGDGSEITIPTVLEKGSTIRKMI